MMNLAVFERMPRPGRDAGTWGYLANAFVLEPYRNQGIGRLLLDALLAHAEAEGYVRVVLRPSERSMRFYRRAGFTADGGFLVRQSLPGRENQATDRPLTGRITSVAATFVPGLQLAREFYAAEVRPLLEGQFPQVPYAASLIGPGSEIAGFDTVRSTDHDWGPRLQVFLTATPRYAAAITAMLGGRLPESFRGYPVAFPLTREPGGTARHRVEVAGLGAWLGGRLGFDPRQTVTLLDWLAVPAQRLAEFTAGAVFYDGPGELTRARAALAWYPHDLWLHLLACQWQRIGQEEAFPGRCAEAGDDLGSLVATTRLARDLIRLALLMHRRYPPYSKWLGTALARLPGTGGLAASLTAAIFGGSWPVRELHLRDAYETVAALHNQLGLTLPLDTRTRPFYDRPYQVIGADRFTVALREAITDPQVRRLPLTGAIDQFIDSTDAVGDLGFLRACARAAVPELA